MPDVRHSTVQVGPANVFYRSRYTGQPVLLLLHGFANSSHYFRHLMPKLAGGFHLIAPDLPSFGFTTVEEGAGYQFTFANLTKTIQGFVNELSLPRFAMYVFDYGAPVGFNLDGLWIADGTADKAEAALGTTSECRARVEQPANAMVAQ